MTAEIMIVSIAICCFAIASVIALTQLFRPNEQSDKYILIFSVCGFIPVVLLLVLHSIKQGRLPAFGRFEAISFYSMAVFLSYLILTLRYRLKGISALVLPFVTVFLAAAAAGLNEELTLSAKWPAGWLVLHIITAFAGYGLFTTSGILAACYIIQDHNLKHKKLGRALANMPSLETLDKVMRRQIGTGFTMFTASIVFGIIMARQATNSSEWIGDAKVAATATTWFVYAVLLHLRTTADRHGKKIAFVTIAGLFFVLFAFFGVHMIAESAHDFIVPPGN